MFSCHLRIWCVSLRSTAIYHRHKGVDDENQRQLVLPDYTSHHEICCCQYDRRGRSVTCPCCNRHRIRTNGNHCNIPKNIFHLQHPDEITNSSAVATGRVAAPP